MTTSPVPMQRKAALVFIFVTVLIDVLAFGVIIPVLPHLLKDFAGGNDAKAAYWVVLFGTLFSLIQFFCAPIQGALSDRYGRRPVILLSCLGLGLDFVLMALAPSLWWLLVGRMIAAVTSASFTTANAYIADISTDADRAKNFGLVGAAFGLGFIVGPLIGGELSHYSPRLPFWFSAVLALLNFVYGMFVLPESLPKPLRTPTFDWSHANPLGSLRLLRDYPAIWGLVAVVFLANLAHYVYPSVFVLSSDLRYGWQEREAGRVLAVVGVLSVLVNVWLVGVVIRQIGERRALLLGLSCGVIGFLIYGGAPVGWMFLIGLPISALWAIAGPASQTLITRQVGADVQGRIQGALSSLNSLGGVIGPAVFAGSYGYFVSDAAPLRLPGIAFLIAALLLASAVLVGWRYARAPALQNAALAETS